MAPFYGWGSTASRLEPLQGGSLSSDKQSILETRRITDLHGSAHFTIPLKKGAKQKILSVALHISGAIHHIIFIYVIHMC